MSRRITELDGLRALAFLAVFTHHALGVPRLWLGVDLFFVLSGYLITGNLLAARDRHPPARVLRTFYLHRLLRIAPPYYVALALILLVAPLPLRDASWYLAFASNLRDALWPPLQGPFNALWSIALEEQFYLVWPWLVLFVRPAALGRMFVFILLCAPVFRLVCATISPDAVYRLMPCRMDLLAAGALLAHVEAGRPGWLAARRAWFGASALLGAAAFGGLALGVPSFELYRGGWLFDVAGFGLSTVVFTSVIAWVRGGVGGPVRRVLNLRVLQALGLISYMSYLLHPLALVLAGRLGRGALATAAVGLAGTLGAATLSWHLLEKPLQRWRRGPTPQATEAAAPGDGAGQV